MYKGRKKNRTIIWEGTGQTGYRRFTYTPCAIIS